MKLGLKLQELIVHSSSVVGLPNGPSDIKHHDNMDDRRVLVSTFLSVEASQRPVSHDAVLPLIGTLEHTAKQKSLSVFKFATSSVQLTVPTDARLATAVLELRVSSIGQTRQQGNTSDSSRWSINEVIRLSIATITPKLEYSMLLWSRVTPQRWLSLAFSCCLQPVELVPRSLRPLSQSTLESPIAGQTKPAADNSFEHDWMLCVQFQSLALPSLSLISDGDRYGQVSLKLTAAPKRIQSFSNYEYKAAACTWQPHIGSKWRCIDQGGIWHVLPDAVSADMPGKTI